jgi:hypothetical protein
LWTYLSDKFAISGIKLEQLVIGRGDEQLFDSSWGVLHSNSCVYDIVEIVTSCQTGDVYPQYLKRASEQITSKTNSSLNTVTLNKTFAMDMPEISYWEGLVNNSRIDLSIFLR